VMENNYVKLSWTQENELISGFKILRNTGGEPITILAQIQKSKTIYFDSSVQAGKKYTYYILAVAGTNKSDTIKVEITPVFLPIVKTGAVTEITDNSAKIGGSITSTEAGTITSKGICWSTTPNPTINNNKNIEGTGSGEFVSTLTNLNPASTYYARAYAENIRGVSYGSEIVFTTNKFATVIDIDGNVYPTVKICDQIWMAENLKVSKYRNEDPILNIQDNNAWANTRSGAWCNYNNDSPNDLVYGKLYNGYAVTDARGLAPAGWHIPTKTEWDQLITCLSNDQVNPANKMKTVTGWSPTNVGATNSSGFSGLPGGERGRLGEFVNIGSYGYWYSSTLFTGDPQSLVDPIWFASLSYIERGVYQDPKSKIMGLSVRCIKD
jgi:uncharacterized protein (TIGR02145 family)